MTKHSLSYNEIIRNIAASGFGPFEELNIPYCYVKICNPFYDWARLVSCKRGDNIHHCHVELLESVSLETLNGMAECSEPGWALCPYMLRAAASPEEFSGLDLIKSETVDRITLLVWNALEYLLDDYSDGGDFVDINLAFLTCWYRSLIAHGTLRFKYQRYSGLENQVSLAMLVDYAMRMGFWIEDSADQLIIEHDKTVALQDAASFRLIT